jgi:hypothetical protein
MPGASTIDKLALRQFGALKFQRPSDVLREALPDIGGLIRKDSATPLTRQPKAIREIYHAALIGVTLEKMCENLGHPGKVWLAMKEAEDYDCILKADIPNEELNEKMAFVKLQLKTLPDVATAPDASLEGILNKAKVKYKRGHDLALGIHIQRDLVIDYARLDLKGLEIQQLWISGHPREGITTVSGGMLEDLRRGWLQTATLSDLKTVEVSQRPFIPK